MTPDRSAEKIFSTQKKAEAWARAFDYARSLLVPPLPPGKAVQRADGAWVVHFPPAS